jgi:hypothetical protein
MFSLLGDCPLGGSLCFYPQTALPLVCGYENPAFQATRQAFYPDFDTLRLLYFIKYSLSM